MAVQEQLIATISDDDPQEATISFASQLQMMLRALWESNIRNQLIWLSSILLAIILITAYAQILLNRWNVPFYDALERRDIAAFLYQLRIFFIIAGALLLLNVTQTWFGQIATLKMREGLARDLVGQWLQPKRALRLSASGIIGVNPDQRLHEDARHLSEITTTLTIGLLQATILLASFVGVLWNLSSGFVFHVGTASFSIPGYMVWAAALYAASASLMSALVGHKLVGLNANRYSKEAELRSSLMRANENLATITLLRGESNERQRIDADINSVLAVIRRLALAHTNLKWVSASYGWLTIIVPILIAAPVYFSGGLTFGGLMMAVGAFNQVYTALRWYVDNFDDIADWKATLMRVANFRHALEQMGTEKSLKGTIAITRADYGTLAIRNLGISADKRTMPSENGFRLRERDVTIHAGERVLINGDPGVNRKLLFNALAGYWPWGTGKITMPPEDDILFVPQTGYFPYGTLRSALAFPDDAATYDDGDMTAALERAGLERLTNMLDTRERWDRMLGRDEQACLLFANALLHNPRWMILDNALEGLEPETQERLAAVLADLPRTGIIYIGRSETFIDIVAPRILHLEALALATA